MVPVQPHSHNTFATAVDVDIATPEIIVSVYLLLYVPLAMAWAYFVHYGYQEKHYLILVPFTLCAFTVGLDLVNQSLSTLTAAPMALTTIQAGLMFAITAVWTLGCHIYGSFTGRVAARQDEGSSRVPSELSLYPLSCGSLVYPLLRWMPAALWFVAYQLINHEVSLYCSLSERTVFLNLCPLCAVFIEPLVLPSSVSRGFSVSFSSKMALITMASGALLFSLQYPDFSANGARAAGLLVAIVLPYRLLQRMLLAECREAPASLLCAVDGLLLMLPAGVLTTLDERFFLEAWNVWLRNPSIMLMLALSVFAFVGNHMAVLYLLKATSATSTLVFSNLSNFVVVFEGIVFFSDPVLQAPLVMAGIIFSLFGGVWYAVDQQESRKSPQEPAKQRQGSDGHLGGPEADVANGT
ncbi:NCL1 [Symbiodinium natans]|uniref:NCL1 protein n=1 Tax=Symbiodinium natans TaxID=878477 RepID=A0A812KB12_9DINO|nr:NCL1 [Symbiodinium natans]